MRLFRLYCCKIYELWACLWLSTLFYTRFLHSRLAGHKHAYLCWFIALRFHSLKRGRKHRTSNKVNKLVFARKADKVLMENMFEESQSKNNVYLASFSSMTNIGLQNFSVINVFLEITEFNANQKAFHVNKYSTIPFQHFPFLVPIIQTRRK